MNKTPQNQPVTHRHILDSVEASIRILAGLQQGLQPSAVELKRTIDDLRMSRMILTRGPK